jgi:hypothetical protein
VKIKLVGGAAVMEDQHIFNIGENNINAVKKILKDQGLRIFSEDTGGDASRTVTLHVATGRTVVSNIKKGIWKYEHRKKNDSGPPLAHSHDLASGLAAISGWSSFGYAEKRQVMDLTVRFFSDFNAGKFYAIKGMLAPVEMSYAGEFWMSTQDSYTFWA